MDNRTDHHLLCEYAEMRSEAAFAELVRRYLDLVYSSALRMVRDPHAAKDVTQGTFVALAQNAGQLSAHPVLAGWLHRTAQNIAVQSVRAEVRRRAREQETAAMNELLAGETDPNWEQISPQLDAALGELNETDRDALLLRYFQRQSAQEMASSLGVSAEAAQKRVTRAVERLREFLAKRGVAVGAGGLAVLLSTHAVQAAPVGLTITISAAASTTTTVLKSIAMTTFQKTLSATAVAVALVTAVSTGVFLGYRAVSSRSAPTDAAAEEFSFQVGEHLDGNIAPLIAGRAFTITTVFDAQQQDGVIVAQGGLAHGYAIYVEGGELFFALRRNNALTMASAGPVGNGRRTATASFSQSGALSVALDGSSPGIAQAAGVITMKPTDGLDVGADKGGAVGPYAPGNPFGGTIESVTLRLFR